MQKIPFGHDRKIFVAKLKQESKAQRVTNVEGEYDFFEQDVYVEGNCHKRNPDGSWTLVGRYYIMMELNKDGSLGAHIDGGKVS